MGGAVSLSWDRFEVSVVLGAYQEWHQACGQSIGIG